MYLVYQFSPSENPELLSQALWRLKIPHRIVNNHDRNELWVTEFMHQAPSKQLVQMWHDDPALLLKVEPNPSQTSSRHLANVMTQMKASPATLVLLMAALMVAFVTQLGSNLFSVGYFTISPIEIRGNQIRFYHLAEVLAQGEYWRLVTPALLHFSVMHIVFNSLWVWEIGRKLERLLGVMTWSIGILVIATVSNILQFQLSGNPLFGGLSGVVYGLIGFAWLTPLLIRQWPMIISKQLMIFFMVWLAIGYTPFPKMLGISIANTAHTIGLVAGLLLACLYWLATRRRYS